MARETLAHSLHAGYYVSVIYKVGEALVDEFIAAHSGKSLLSFSRGKDSIAAYLAIRDRIEVVPFHLILVPGLSFVDESLDLYERRLFGRRILRFPHPAFYRWLNESLYQTPERAEVIAAAQLPNFGYADVNALVAEQEGLSPAVFTAVGMRSADSPLRRLAFRNYGPIRDQTKLWYPVWDWNKARLIEEITRAGVSLPDDYLIWGRTFDGLDAQFLVSLKRQRPQDYARILVWFPLVDVEVWRYERDQAA